MANSTNITHEVTLMTDSLVPKVFISSYVDAIADVEINAADVLELSDGTYIHDGIIEWCDNGLVVGDWYYLDQSVAGGYTNIKPTSGLVQQLFFVRDEDTILVDIEEAYNVDAAQFVVCLDTEADRLSLPSPQPDTIYIIKDSCDNGSNIRKTWTYDLLGTEWIEQETEVDLNITDTIVGNPIANIGLANSCDTTQDTINETITNFDTPVVDLTDPQNPIVTLPYNQEGGTTQDVQFTFNIPNPISVVNSIDLVLTGTDLTVNLDYTDDEGNNSIISDTTPITIPISTYVDNGDGSYTHTSGDGTEEINYPSFQIGACVPKLGGCLGQTDLDLQVNAFNVLNAPVTWSIDSFDGIIDDATIDASGLITYDLIATPTNNGLGEILVTATDAGGQTTTSSICITANDPVDVTTLACDGNIVENNQDIVDKMILFAKADQGSMYQDLAKTTLATNTGDPVSVLEDATGGGDIIVVAPDSAPTLSLGAINGENTLVFTQANDSSLEYAVPSAPPQGTAFKFFALVRLDGTVTNSSIISSVTVGNTSNTGSGTWQITDDDGFFAFRYAGGATSTALGSTIGATDTRSAITRAQMNDGNAHLIYCKYDGDIASGGTNTVELFWDGIKVVEVTLNQPLFGQYLKPFENRGSSDFIDGELAEMIYADGSMTDEEALTTQAYLICKYGLDASLLAYAAPFELDKTSFYDTISQFELQTLCTGEEVVYDTVNNIYYPLDNVPTPGLGLFKDPATAELLNQIASGGTTETITSISNEILNGDNLEFDYNQEGGTTQTISVDLSSLKIQRAATGAASMDRERVMRDEDGVVFMQAGRLTNLTFGDGSAQLINSTSIDFQGNGNSTTPAAVYVTDHVFTFPEPFTNGVPVVTLNLADLNDDGHSSIQKVSVTNVSTTGFTLRAFDYVTSSGVEASWIAVG